MIVECGQSKLNRKRKKHRSIRDSDEQRRASKSHTQVHDPIRQVLWSTCWFYLLTIMITSYAVWPERAR